MIKEIKIEKITIRVLSEGGNVRVKSDKENIVLYNQNVDNVSEVIKDNFNIVISHYEFMIEKGKKVFDHSDVSLLTLSIVFHYLYIYNSWRSMYRNQENKDLKFNEKDFNNPSTHDIIFNFFKSRYSNGWKEKCAILLGMELKELEEYYKTREDFYNK